MGKRRRKKAASTGAPAGSIAKRPASPPRTNAPRLATALAHRKLDLLRALLIVAAGLWVFWPALRGDWLWDDDNYVTNNLLLHDLSGLEKIWLEPKSFVEYYPITQSVLWVQWHLWGMDTLGYHLTNLALHLLSALLVWRLLGKFGLRLAWLGGLLFAIHPVQVESVAWISELKNTLSLPLFLLAMCAWIDYEKNQRRADYFWALGWFLAALLCKITVAPFPVAMLLYAWWRRGRIGWSDLQASAPFFVLSLILGITTVDLGAAYNHADTLKDTVALSLGTMSQGGWLSRVALAGLSLAFYFSSCVWPAGRLPIYPQWPVDPPTLLQFLPWPVLGGVLYVLWRKRRGWGRAVLLGGGFFVVMLSPFVLVHWPFTWVMDHILYIPIIGLIGLAVAAMGQVEERLPPSLRFAGIGVVAVVMALLLWGSHSYAGMFVNQEALWTYTLQRNPQAYMAHNNLGLALEQTGREAEAIDHYEQALRLKPDYAEAYNNLGNAFEETGHKTEAMKCYERALHISPYYPEAHNNLGLALERSGRNAEAIGQFELALRFNPYFADAYNNLGSALVRTGQAAEAIGRYEQALKIKPDYAEVHYNLGIALEQAGQEPEAIAHYEQAIKSKPDYAGAHYNLGLALEQTGREAEAIAHYEQAIKSEPDYVEAHYNLGLALAQAGRGTEAMEQFEQTLKLKPGYAEAHNNLGVVLELAGRPSEAMEQFAQAVKSKPDYAEAHNNLGNALLQAGKRAEAIEHYEQAVKLKPDYAEAHCDLGIALEQSGRIAEAIGQFEQAVKLKPDYAAARSNLERLEALQKAAPAKN